MFQVLDKDSKLVREEYDMIDEATLDDMEDGTYLKIEFLEGKKQDLTDAQKQKENSKKQKYKALYERYEESEDWTDKMDEFVRKYQLQQIEIQKQQEQTKKFENTKIDFQIIETLASLDLETISPLEFLNQIFDTPQNFELLELLGQEKTPTLHDFTTAYRCCPKTMSERLLAYARAHDTTNPIQLQVILEQISSHIEVDVIYPTGLRHFDPQKHLLEPCPETRQKVPLNGDVANIIFHYLDSIQLSFLRTVNKSWNKSIKKFLKPLPKFCTNCFGMFIEDDNIEKSCYYHSGVHRERLTEYHTAWFCCWSPRADSPACQVGYHTSGFRRFWSCTSGTDSKKWTKTEFRLSFYCPTTRSNTPTPTYFDRLKIEFEDPSMTSHQWIQCLRADDFIQLNNLFGANRCEYTFGNSNQFVLIFDNEVLPALWMKEAEKNITFPGRSPGRIYLYSTGLPTNRMSHQTALHLKWATERKYKDFIQIPPDHWRLKKAILHQ